jgi:hypothetical protein
MVTTVRQPVKGQLRPVIWLISSLSVPTSQAMEEANKKHVPMEQSQQFKNTPCAMG